MLFFGWNEPAERPSYFDFKPDPRTINFPLITSCVPVVTLILIYIVVFGIFFPNFWNQLWIPLDRARELYMISNLFLLIVNGFLSCGFIIFEIQLQYSFFCQKVETDGQDSEDEKIIAVLMYTFFICKLLEWLDTIVSAINNGMGNLWKFHICHHSSIVLVSWLGVKYVPGGSAAVMATTNSVSHFGAYLFAVLLDNGIFVNNPSRRGMKRKMIATHFGIIIFCAISSYISDCGFSRDASLILLNYILLISTWLGYHWFLR